MNTPRTGAIIELIARAVNQTDRAQFLALCMDAERGIAELERELAALRERLADALEENARLKAERDTSVAVTERIKVALRIRGTGSYVEWAAYCRDALEKLDRAEAELAALREQLAERDAEIAALKGHAEAMHRSRSLATYDYSGAFAAYRAAYPKED